MNYTMSNKQLLSQNDFYRAVVRLLKTSTLTAFSESSSVFAEKNLIRLQTKIHSSMCQKVASFDLRTAL